VMGDPAGRQPTRDSPGIANKQPSPAAKQPPRDAVDSRAAGPDGAVSSGDEQVMGAAASPAAAAAQDGAANSTPGTAAAAVSAVPQQEQEEEAPDPESVLRRLLAKRGRTEFEKLYVHALLRDHEATLPPDLVAEARARCALPPRSAGKAAAAAAAAGGGGGRGRGRGRLPARANDDDFPSPQLSSSSSEEGAAAGASGARPRHTPGSGSPGGRRDRQRVHGRERATQYRRQRRAKVSGSPSGKAGQLPDAGLQAQGLHDDDADCADWMARLDDDDDEQMGSDMDMPFPHQMPEQPAGQPGRRAKRAKGQGAAPAGSPPQQAAGTPPPSDVAGPSLLDYLAAVAADAEAQLG
jgi:translation initiation factor IF-2